MAFDGEVVLTERVMADDWKSKHDAEKGVVKGVLLCGMKSVNRRRYSEKAIKEAVKLYENAAMNFDHPEGETVGGKARKFDDRFAIAKNVKYVPGKGAVGEIHYNVEHGRAKQFGWWVDNHPNAIGISPNQRGKGNIDAKEGVMLIESITRVKSLDIVADPATTDGISCEEVLMEGVLAERLAEQSALRQLYDVCDTAIGLVRNNLHSEDLSKSLTDRAAQIADILREWKKAITTSTQEETLTEDEEEDDMDLKTLTLDTLRKERPDLVEIVLKESKDSDDEQMLLEENQDLKDKLRKYERDDKIASLFRKHALPDSKEARSEHFLKLLESQDDEQLLEEAVKERAMFFKTSTKKRSVVSEPHGGTTGTDKEPMSVKGFAAAVKGR